MSSQRGSRTNRLSCIFGWGIVNSAFCPSDRVRAGIIHSTFSPFLHSNISMSIVRGPLRYGGSFPSASSIACSFSWSSSGCRSVSSLAQQFRKSSWSSSSTALVSKTEEKVIPGNCSRSIFVQLRRFSSGEMLEPILRNVKCTMENVELPFLF